MHFHGKANKGQEEGETGRVERQRKYTHKHTHTLRTFIIITMIVLIIDDHSLPLQLFLFICSASSASASASTSSSLACSCCLNCIPTRSISEKQTEKNSLASFFSLFIIFQMYSTFFSLLLFFCCRRRRLFLLLLLLFPLLFFFRCFFFFFLLFSVGSTWDLFFSLRLLVSPSNPRLASFVLCILACCWFTAQINLSFKCYQGARARLCVCVCVCAGFSCCPFFIFLSFAFLLSSSDCQISFLVARLKRNPWHR